MDTFFHSTTWSLPIDIFPTKELHEIFPYLERAKSLYARHRDEAHIVDGYLNIYGAIKMMKGMDYHFDNFYKCVDEDQEAHEVVAYLNRVGQFFDFACSDYTESKVASPLEFLPTICKFIPLRNKHAAHRPLDDPRKNDPADQEDHPHYLALMFLDGSLCDREGNRMFQFLDGSGHVNFTMAKDHPLIMKEAYALIHAIVMQTNAVISNRAH
jgi:hypothetical protein